MVSRKCHCNTALAPEGIACQVRMPGGGVSHSSSSHCDAQNLIPVVGDRFLSSTGTGRNCALPIRVPNCSPTLDKILAPIGPEILSNTGAGVWRKVPTAFPDSSSVLDKFQSATCGYHRDSLIVAVAVQ